MKTHKAFILLFWISIWYLAALCVGNSILLATPLQTLQRLAELVVTLTFWQTIGLSLLRIAGGFFLGSLIGILLAAVSYKKSFVEELLVPVMSLLKTVPVASMVVLLLIWWGSSLLAVSICFIVVLPQMYINTLEGLKSTDKKLMEMAEVFKLPLKNRFFYIYRPTLKPFVTSSMKIALGMSWKSGVAAEVIGTPDFSIGERLYLSKIYLDTAGVFAWTAVIIVLSVCFEKLVLWLAERFFVWEPMCRKPLHKERAENTSQDGKASQNEKLSEKKSGLPAAHIICTHIFKSYGSKTVLSDFGAEYAPGQTYYLRDPSGSGKTTLLRLLSGLEQPDSGKIHRSGSVSVAFQEDRLCEEYSALRNVELVTGERGRAEEALKEMDLGEDIDKPCSHLSGGMKRRVALIRAMEAESDIVLLDEPFTGMDEETRNLARAYIERKQKGRILIMATHI